MEYQRTRIRILKKWKIERGKEREKEREHEQEREREREKELLIKANCLTLIFILVGLSVMGNWSNKEDVTITLMDFLYV